jgi:hypothetical protein
MDSSTFNNGFGLFHPNHMSRENPEFASLFRQAMVRDHSLGSDFFLKVHNSLAQEKGPVVKELKTINNYLDSCNHMLDTLISTTKKKSDDDLTFIKRMFIEIHSDIIEINNKLPEANKVSLDSLYAKVLKSQHEGILSALHEDGFLNDNFIMEHEPSEDDLQRMDIEGLMSICCDSLRRVLDIDDKNELEQVLKNFEKHLDEALSYNNHLDELERLDLNDFPGGKWNLCDTSFAMMQFGYALASILRKRGVAPHDNWSQKL